MGAAEFMKRHSLYFIAPGQVEVREEALPAGEAGQVLVQTLVSAISPGTELLIFRGQAPAHLPADTTIAALSGSLAFPLKYGYACVGQVLDGSQGDMQPGQIVFAFHPHESHFWADTTALHPVPAACSPEDAAFLANVETAVNFLHDGAPLAGEQVVVFGQGIVGLLTIALLARLPLTRLITLDHHARRRQQSLDLGAAASLDPADGETPARLQALLHPHGADLVYELSGQPAALDQAIAVAGFGGRVVVGSWYGVKRADLDLGGHFHRNRIRLTSSQVSTLAPELSGRWDKARRLAFAWQALAELRPSRFVTHRFPLAQAAAAYDLLDRQPQAVLQALFTYRPAAA